MELTGPPQAIFFDFDGTLIDSYPAITASVNYVRGRHGLSPLPEEEVRRHVGRGPYYLLEHTVPSGETEQNVVHYREHHPSVMLTGTSLLPGAAGLVQGLAAADKQVALCSNKPRAFSQELLAHLGLRDQFAAVLGPEDVVRPKPAPDMLIEGLRRLQVAADRALYIGDMSVDIETARAAGVPVWVVPTGSEAAAALQAAHPDRLLRDLVEAQQLLVDCQ
jgi:phosphoglycolate phosphatase